MTPHSNPVRSSSRRGVVLVAVLVVVVVLSLAAYQLSDLMMAEYRAADSYLRYAQARTLADSGAHYVAALLSNPDTMANALNNRPYDNPAMFQGVLVNPNDPPRFQGRFSVIAPIDPNDPLYGSQPYRFGVTDESGKINLNALMQLDSSGQVLHDMLMNLNLPNLNEDIVNAILDWLDPDDEPRTNGAESDYYGSLTPPYRCRNGPIDSLEELLLVKGVTPQVLLGNDRNRNGILDPDEDDGSGTLDRGLASYLTVYSREQNVDSQGNQRIYVNDKDLDTLYQTLSDAVGPDLAAFIIAYRTYGADQPPPSPGGGPPSSGPSGAGGPPASGSPVRPPPQSSPSSPDGTRLTTSSAPAGPAPPLTRNNINTKGGGQPKPIASLYELINTQVSIPAANPQGQPTKYPSPLNDPATLKQMLPVLLDKVTTRRNLEIPARINVNTASPAVLMALPGIAPEEVQNILDHRPNPSSTDPPDPIFQTPAWLISEANLPPKRLQSLERYITASSQVYRAQVLGYFDRGGPTARIEVVIDTNQGYPRVLYWRDLTELGKGYDPKQQPSNP